MKNNCSLELNVLQVTFKSRALALEMEFLIQFYLKYTRLFAKVMNNAAEMKWPFHIQSKDR